ncbi:permease-like cell division protein FtsX [Streptosporangium subroseum]|uniref:permease-like cell division protein FtsX n=1 Tax=Streptosporangium subroseum TaxID=106412 RepID=UPI0034158E5A
MDSEELSFGEGDPEREPRLRAWAAAHTRLLAACTAVLVVLGFAGVGGWYLYERSWLPQPPPDIELPVQLRFEVRLCGTEESQWSCRGRQEATVAERQSVEAHMRAQPQLTRVLFRSPEWQYEWALALYATLGGGQPGTRATDKAAARESFPSALEGTLRRSGDFAAVAAQLEVLPGVAYVERRPTNFWSGKAEIWLPLCTADDYSEQICKTQKPDGNKRAVTQAEKDAIAARLREVPGVERIYFQDLAHTMKLMRHYYPESLSADGAVRADLLNEAFYVKLSDLAAAPRVIKAVGALPGILIGMPVPPVE